MLYESCAVPEELFAGNQRDRAVRQEMEEAVFTDDKADKRRKYP